MSIKKYVIKAVIVNLMLLSPATVLANVALTESSLDMNLGARHKFTTWEGSNDSNNSKFDADASVIGVDFTLRYRNYYGGISVAGGSFRFKGNAPDRPTAPNPASTVTTIKRTELNLIVGYQITPRVSIFTGLQNIKNDWKDEDYAVEYTGLGLGVNGNYALTPQWTIYGSIGVIPLKISQPSGTEIGDGRGASLEFGGSYILETNMALSLSIKSQSREFDYDTAADQTHDISGLLFRYNYTFR